MGRKLLAVVALIGSVGCSVKDQKTPEMIGPSSLGYSISATATPASLVLDGRSQSVVTVQALGPDGKPTSVLLDLGTTPAGAGQLTVSQVTTDSDGRATFGFVAANTPGDPSKAPSKVTISLTPSGSHAGEVSRKVDIALSVGNHAPVASFSYSPATPQTGSAVSFDASASTDEGQTCGSNCTYAWDFGDGSTGSGQTASRTYTVAGTYAVKLSVTDGSGATGTATQNVVVTAAVLPTPSFTFLPASPEINATITFDATATTFGGAACGSNCTYAWDFGDGSTGTGVTATHAFATAKSYVIKLTVTETHGATAVLTKTLTVTATAPTASFTTNPVTPVGVFQEVTFNAAASSAAAGRTISSYTWEFGDGGTATGVSATHTYNTTGSYTVTLTVTDSQNIQGSTTKTLVVEVGITADFTFSPTDPAPGDTVYFNAEASKGSPGFGGRNSITQYIWSFGDSTSTETITSPITSHAFGAERTYTVNLTVVDSAGRRATTSKTIGVAIP